MPFKKIDQKKYSRKVLVLKTGGILLLILITYFSYVLIGNEPEKSALKRPDLHEVLGETTSSARDTITAEITRDIEIIRRELETLTKILQEQGAQLYSNNREELEKSALETINEKAINPIITQIQRLPETQQDYLKEQLCQ